MSLFFLIFLRYLTPYSDSWIPTRGADLSRSIPHICMYFIALGTSQMIIIILYLAGPVVELVISDFSVRRAIVCATRHNNNDNNNATTALEKLLCNA